MSLMSIGALKFSSRQYPLNYICLGVFVSLNSFNLNVCDSFRHWMHDMFSVLKVVQEMCCHNLRVRNMTPRGRDVVPIPSLFCGGTVPLP